MTIEQSSPRDDEPPAQVGSDELASVIAVEPREDVATICGRVDTAPTFAVVVYAPKGNRQLGTELGMRRLVRHGEEAGKILAIATSSRSVVSRAHEVGIPVARKPQNVRWDSGGRNVFSLGSRSLVLPSVGKYVPALAIAAAIVLVAVVALAAAPSADVVVTPQVDTLTTTVNITASPDVDAINLETMTVPASRIEDQRVITLTVPTTGKVAVGTVPAKVIVSLTNTTGADVVVPLGAVLSSTNPNVTYLLDAETLVPAGKAVTQQATAAHPGTVANLPAGAVRGWNDERYKGLAVTNPAAAAGGANEDRQAVAAADITALATLAAELGKSSSARALVVAARPHDAVFPETADLQVEAGSPSAIAGTPADFLFMDCKLSISVLAVLEKTLEDLARAVLSEGQGTGEFVAGSVSALASGSTVDPDSGAVSAEITLRGEFAHNVTAGAIRDAVKGKSEEDARSTLASRYGIQNADVRVSPGWAPWLPRLESRIDVELKSPSPVAEPSATANEQSSQAGAAPPRP